LVVGVSFAPEDTGSVEGVLTFVSNDPDEPTVTVALRGTGVYPPDIAVSPDSFAVTLDAGDSTSRMLTIGNVGLGPLAFDISINSSILSGGTVLIIGDGETELTLESILTAAGYSVTIVSDDAIYDGTNPRPEGFGAVILVDGVDYGDDMPESGQTALVNYVANGGGFIVTEWIAWEIYEGRYSILSSIIPLTCSDWYDDTDTYTVVEDHPVTEGVSPSFAIYTAGNIGNAVSGLVLVTGAIAGDAVVADEVGRGRIVQFSSAGNDEGDPFSNEDMRLLMINAVDWAKRGDWLTVNPTSGTVPAGDSLEVSVGLNASDLFGGDYHGNLLIHSNDPDLSDSLKAVPVLMTVIGMPDIAVSPDTLSFGEEFVLAGRGEVVVVNAGTDSLVVSSVSSDTSVFVPDTTSFALNARDSLVVGVSFAPEEIGAVEGMLSFVSNDPDEGTVTVVLKGTGVYPPELWVSPDVLTDTLYTG
ncbi:MAG: choice-of-anchor D domain-containing protein, partial [Candidatus Latescibacteria bacterium]|nr:choice-of-anchor D domain-containing protein [Candidatus Latescibacterota bacterium]